MSVERDETLPFFFSNENGNSSRRAPPGMVASIVMPGERRRNLVGMDLLVKLAGVDLQAGSRHWIPHTVLPWQRHDYGLRVQMKIALTMRSYQIIDFIGRGEGI